MVGSDMLVHSLQSCRDRFHFNSTSMFLNSCLRYETSFLDKPLFTDAYAGHPLMATSLFVLFFLLGPTIFNLV